MEGHAATLHTKGKKQAYVQISQQARGGVHGGPWGMKHRGDAETSLSWEYMFPINVMRYTTFF